VTSQLVRSPRSSSSAEALSESVQDQRSFLSLGLVECRSSAGILRILIESIHESLSCWIIVGDLPIIVSLSFTSLMLFVHLHII
jgi:hypothetical protein